MTSTNTGSIAQIFGPVVNVRFPSGKLSPIYNAVLVRDPQAEIDLTLEVAQHRGKDVVRCGAMSTTDGCRRGMSALDSGGPMGETEPGLRPALTYAITRT